MTHSNLINQTLIKANKIKGTRLWSCPNGLAWNGTQVSKYQKNGKQYLVLENPRPVKYGLVPGSSDTIGFHTVQNFPVFTAIEIKTSGDNLKPQQKKFLDLISYSGGFSGVLRKEEDLYNILKI